MLKKKLYIFILLLSFNFFSCENKVLLEYKYIMDYNLQELNIDGKTLLKIYGKCMHSSYSIKKIKTKIVDDILIINIELSYFIKTTDEINYELFVPENVNKVVIGNLKKEIWHR